MKTPPLILFEDEHLLVINKPPGINTHSASPFASEGIYDWLRNRSPQWASLAIHQRLDQETSGVMLFGKSRKANQSLARQFEERGVRKTYHLLTDRDPGPLPSTIRSRIQKGAGGQFRSTVSSSGKASETRFRLIGKSAAGWLIEARPMTGRTHQIRIHAGEAGFPILGDGLYGGSSNSRVCLHAYSLSLMHPEDRRPLGFNADIDFSWDPHGWLRHALWPEPETNAWRLIHGGSSGFPDWYVDRLGDYLLSQSESEISGEQSRDLEGWCRQWGLRGVYHKRLDRHVRKSQIAEASPVPIHGKPAAERFGIRENGIEYVMSFEEGYSVGLFLDQKDNRHRLLTGHFFQSGEALNPLPLEGQEVLNTFAYTCGFSVCAAKSGATVTSLDLSTKYLDWGRENFRRNGLDPDEHDFIYGDCFDWIKRLRKKERRFDLVLLDPPTFSKSKKSGLFRAGKDYGKLVSAVVPLVKPRGLLFASTNCATLEPEDFLETVRSAIHASGRKLAREFFVPQSPDFPNRREEPGYLKTVWLRLE